MHVMLEILGLGTAVVVAVLALVSLYQWLFACAALIGRRRTSGRAAGSSTRFLIMIPAHDEEHSLPDTLRSLQSMRYPRSKWDVVVVADRCRDATGEVARAHGAVCLERTTGEGVKGAALAWGIQEAARKGLSYDALLILDADTRTSPDLLAEFDAGFEAGYRVQQAYNYLSNPWETPFTRVIAVTSTLKNGLYYAGKTRLGLSGMLQGTGMCLAKAIVDQYGWSAFSVGEDWEFSVSLVLAGEHIHFNPDALIYAKESSGVKQASRQRLRWATGRYAVTGTTSMALLTGAVRRRSWQLLDAAVTMMCPNYSTQASIVLFCVACAAFLSSQGMWESLFPASLAVLGLLALYLLAGVLKTDSPMRTLRGLAFIPVFLPWRLGIELLGLMGFGRGGWGRSARQSSSPSSQR